MMQVKEFIIKLPNIYLQNTYLQFNKCNTIQHSLIQEQIKGKVILPKLLNSSTIQFLSFCVNYSNWAFTFLQYILVLLPYLGTIKQNCWYLLISQSQ